MLRGCLWAAAALPIVDAFISVPVSRRVADETIPDSAVTLRTATSPGGAHVVNTNVGRRPGLPYVTVYIGTPPQALDLQIDTGSSDFVIAGSECTNCGVARPFRCNASTTCHTQLCGSHRPYHVCKFQMTYGGGGYIEGDVMSDQFRLSVEEGSLTSAVYIDLVRRCRPAKFFSSHYYNGIFGLGPDTDTGSTLPSPLKMILEEQHLPNIIAIYTGSTIKKVAGVLTLGGVDPHAYVGAIRYTPMVRRGCEAWMYCAEVRSLVVNGRTVVPDPRDFGVTLIDSGTTLTLLPRHVMRQIREFFQRHYCHLPLVCKPKGATIFDGKCIKAPVLPVGFPVMEWSWDGDVTLKVPPEAYFIKETSNKGKATKFCFGLEGVESVPGNPDSTLGDTFMAAAYVVFDRENKRIGFATPDWVPFATGDEASWRQPALAFGFAGTLCGAAMLMLVTGLYRPPDSITEGTDAAGASFYGTFRRGLRSLSRNFVTEGTASSSSVNL
jgi:hypothetical protein